MESLLLESGEQCSPASFDFWRDMSSRFRANTMDLLCGSKYSRNSGQESCDAIIGSAITGKDILVKYLISVFASERDARPKAGSALPAGLGFSPDRRHSYSHSRS